MRLIQLGSRIAFGCALLLLVCALAGTASAAASPVLVLDGHRVVRENDRFVPAADLPRPPGARAAGVKARAAGPSVRTVLNRLRMAGQIDTVEYNDRLATYDRAESAARALSGTRRRELQSVINNVKYMAGNGSLVTSRLEAVFLILERNRQWWTTGRIPFSGERVRFAGSLVIFQYFRGEGLQFHPLANFGKLNGYLNGRIYAVANDLAEELIPLAANRGGGPTWEYYFFYGGGRPPWTSGLSQGTAVQALLNGYQRLGDRTLRDTALAGLRIFELAPPTGVRKRFGSAAHYLIYSYASKYYVANAFIQALNGLHDAGNPAIGNSARARRLFAAGDQRARVELRRYDTGKWSRYSLSGELSSYSYHVLLRDFLRSLCQKTGTAVYCRYATRFTNYL
jgi:D-glucuronyl C5-epimerase-like protein